MKLRCTLMGFGPFLPLLLGQVASVPLDLPNTPGPSLEQAGERGRVAWMTGVLPLGDRLRHNDYPAAAAAPNGDVWVAWSSYAGLREEIHVRRYSQGTWYAAFTVPGVDGDIWMPQVAIDGDGRPWIIWSQQVGYPEVVNDRVNWDLFAARIEGDRWKGPIRLTDHPMPDINHRVASSSDGDVFVVWQGFRNGQTDIFLRSLENGDWTETRQVTTDRGNDWFPDVAVNSAGNVTVVWDSYRHRNYDVFLRTIRDGQWGPVENVAATATGETNASAVYDKEDRLWVAFEEIGVNWSKDHGGRTLGLQQTGTQIGDHRRVRVKILRNGRWMQTAGQLSKAIPDPEHKWMHAPRLHCDPWGRVWLLYRHRIDRYSTWTWAVSSDVTPNTAGQRVFWNTYVTHYDGDAWMPASELPRSRDRMASTMAGAGTPNGQFWVFWHSDNRDDSQVHIPRQNQVWSCVLTPYTRPLAAKLLPARDPAFPDATLAHPRELEDVKALRAHRVSVGGRTYRLYKGDLHRHTELSTDGGGRGDGSIIDFFRYMIDAAEMDYGAITDHSAGGDMEYWWWITQKVTAMYQFPGRYLSLFGYERTPHWPLGHKNIIHAKRNVPVVRLFFRPDIPEQWSTYAVDPSDLVDNDTELVFREVTKTGGIAIPHTLATSQGNDWSVTDPTVQPVAEIYQGARAVYEHEGAPGAHRRKPNVANDTNFNPGGFLWKAWEKGARIGTIASSDHRSTHVSFAMVYSADDSRGGLIEAIRARRTYGATDNILLDFRMGDHLMGEEFQTDTIPDVLVKLRGTAPVAKVSIIRNGKYISQQTPNSPNVSFAFRDTQPVRGTAYYYVRVEQADGNTAWSSPIWVSLR